MKWLSIILILTLQLPVKSQLVTSLSPNNRVGYIEHHYLVSEQLSLISEELEIRHVPFSDYYNVSLKDDQILTYQVFNKRGKMVKSNNHVKMDHVTLELSSLSKGFYTIEVETGKDMFLSGVIEIKKK